MCFALSHFLFLGHVYNGGGGDGGGGGGLNGSHCLSTGILSQIAHHWHVLTSIY